MMMSSSSLKQPKLKRLQILVVGAVVVLLLAASRTTMAMKDSATGIAFDNISKRGLPIFGVGVRRKGPIKVYSVGMYGSDSVKDELAAISRSDDSKQHKKAIATLRRGAAETPTSFVIKMNFKVGAEKMASAIADSVTPRHSSASEVDELRELIFEGVSEKGAAVKGTVIRFDCSEAEGIAVSVDGTEKGTIESSGLARAMCDVYLDDKTVSPKLRESIVEHCCAE